MKEKRYLLSGPPHLHFAIPFTELNDLNKLLRRDIPEIELDLKDKPEIIRIDRKVVKV